MSQYYFADADLLIQFSANQWLTCEQPYQGDVFGRRPPPPPRRRCSPPPFRRPLPPSLRRRPTAAGRAEARSPGRRRRFAPPVGCRVAAPHGAPVACGRAKRGSRRGTAPCRSWRPPTARGRRGAGDASPAPSRAHVLGRTSSGGEGGSAACPCRRLDRCRRGPTRPARRPRRRHPARRRRAAPAPRGDGDAPPPALLESLLGRRVPGVGHGCAASSFRRHARRRGVAACHVHQPPRCHSPGGCQPRQRPAAASLAPPVATAQSHPPSCAPEGPQAAVGATVPPLAAAATRATPPRPATPAAPPRPRPRSRLVGRCGPMGRGAGRGARTCRRERRRRRVAVTARRLAAARARRRRCAADPIPFLSVTAAYRLTAAGRGPRRHYAATHRRGTAAARRRPPPPSRGQLPAPPADRDQPALMVATAALAQALPGTLGAPRPTDLAGRPNRGRHRCTVPLPPLPPRRRLSAATTVPAAASDTAAILGFTSGRRRVHHLGRDAQQPPPPPPRLPPPRPSPSRRRLVRSHGHRQHHSHLKGRDQSWGQHAGGRAGGWPQAARGALRGRQRCRLEPLPPPQVLWGHLWEKRSPPTNHIAGNTRVHEQNNAEMALIQWKSSQNTSSQGKNTVSVRVTLILSPQCSTSQSEAEFSCKTAVIDGGGLSAAVLTVSCWQWSRQSAPRARPLLNSWNCTNAVMHKPGTWPCQLDSRCLGRWTSHPNRILLFAQFWPMPSATQATEGLYISTITFLIFV